MLRNGQPLSVAEAADQLEISRPSASRLLATLRDHEFAVQDPDRRYRAGRNLVSFAVDDITRNDLRRVLRPSLAALQVELNETVNLWVLEGIYVRNLDGIESNELLAIRASAWDRVPAYCSAAGKAMLATLSNHDIDRMHANGLPEWRNQRTTTLAGLKRHLLTVRKRGYATNLEESSQGVFGIGAAVRLPGGVAGAALGCGVPSVRYSAARAHEIAQVLVATADDMTRQLEVFARGGDVVGG